MLVMILLKLLFRVLLLLLIIIVIFIVIVSHICHYLYCYPHYYNCNCYFVVAVLFKCRFLQQAKRSLEVKEEPLSEQIDEFDSMDVMDMDFDDEDVENVSIMVFDSFIYFSSHFYLIGGRLKANMQ